jgi:hypothetical protein
MNCAPLVLLAIATSATNLLVGCADIASPHRDGGASQDSDSFAIDGAPCRNLVPLGPLVHRVSVITLPRTEPALGRGAVAVAFSSPSLFEEPTPVSGCRLELGSSNSARLDGLQVVASVEGQRFAIVSAGQSAFDYIGEFTFVHGDGTDLMATVELAGGCYQPWRVSVITPARPQVMEITLPTEEPNRTYSPNEPLTIRWQPAPSGDVGIWLSGVRRINGVRTKASLQCIRPFADGQFTITPELWQLFDEFGATGLQIGGVRAQVVDAARIITLSSSIGYFLQVR